MWFPETKRCSLSTNTFPNLDFYEFVTDTYASVHLEHSFNGRLFSRIPLVRKWNLREFIGLRGVWGEISPENVALSSPTNINFKGTRWRYLLGVFGWGWQHLQILQGRFLISGATTLTIQMPDALGLRVSFGFPLLAIYTLYFGRGSNLLKYLWTPKKLKNERKKSHHIWRIDWNSQRKP